MPADAADGEVLGLEIAGGLGGVAQGDGVGESLLVRDDERGDEILGGGGDGEFVDAGLFGEGGEATDGEDVDDARLLGDVVDGLEEVLVLLLEGGVELEEVGAFDVPVRVVGDGHQRIGIGKQLLQRGGDGRRMTGFGGGLGGCFHVQELGGPKLWEVGGAASASGIEIIHALRAYVGNRTGLTPRNGVRPSNACTTARCMAGTGE